MIGFAFESDCDRGTDEIGGAHIYEIYVMNSVTCGPSFHEYCACPVFKLFSSWLSFRLTSRFLQVCCLPGAARTPQSQEERISR